jgi:hypothetical protein
MNWTVMDPYATRISGKNYLYNNFLTGTIPASLGKLVKMTHLGLFSNSPTGTVTCLAGQQHEPSRNPSL